MDETKTHTDQLSDRLVAEGVDHAVVRYRDGWVVAVPCSPVSEYRLQLTDDGRWNRYYVYEGSFPVLQDVLSSDVLVADLLRQLEVH